MNSSARILTVEDEEDIQELLKYNLEKNGFSVTPAYTGEEAIEIATSDPPDLILLDLMLPGVGGLDVGRRLRNLPATSDLPIIMLTAKGEDEDIIKGLETGADDYVTKPFNVGVLIARIQAALRRVDQAEDGAVVQIDGLAIDSGKHEAWLGDEKLDLTNSEMAILRALVGRRGNVMTRSQIISEIRGGQITSTDRSIDVHVTSLRKKLKSLGEKILTVRGIGYRFGQ